MDSKEKAKSIEEFRIHERDTGSADVQIGNTPAKKQKRPQLSSWTNYDGQQTSQTA